MFGSIEKDWICFICRFMVKSNTFPPFQLVNRDISYKVQAIDKFKFFKLHII